ncbi:uncharacterized protein LOC135820285 [Sycon ciliatum]|uniref:uncharacterized protein LOC135820285 n=1 Tax=Sycon ciliatum TaxID=27933 RepID=UPI0031F6582F
MVFVAHQLIEKAIEHDTPLYVIFVDLKKAYDSIPREALWLVLGKLGIPPTLLSLIRSLHVGMRARVRISGRLTEDIYVNNGLRQGCTLAPTLFNLYFAAVMSSWRSRSSVPGVSLRSRPGRKLVGDRTTKARLNTYQVTESQFADDAAVYTTSREHLETLANEFIACASQWGLTVSIAKTKAIAVGPGDLQPDVVLDGGGVVEMVSGFTYLGSVVSCDGSLDVEITSRLAKASRVFGCLLTPIFRCRGLSIGIKCMVYRAFVLSTLFYGAETWAVKATHVHRLAVFHRSCIRSILGVSRIQQWEDRLTSAELGRRFGMSLDISDLLRQHRLRWLGHIARMEEHRTPQQMVFGELYATRPRHGPKKRWRDVVVTDLAAAQIGEGEWFHQAQDRPTWKRLCRQQPPPPGPKEFRCACGRPFGRIGDLKRHAPHCRV